MARRLERLFDRYRRGDARALGDVFDRTAPEVLRVAMHFARNASDAEDLLQETFLTAIQRAATFDGGRPLVPWLLGILENHARNRRRKRAPTLLGEAAEDAAAATEPDDGLGNVEWTEAVSRAVEALPETYREVLVLRFRQGLGAAEIAATLGLAPATVRSRIHRGLEMLRERLSPSWFRGAAIPFAAGLDAVRARVLAHASRVTVATAGSSAAVTAIGGLLVTRQAIGIGALALLLLGAGTFVVATVQRSGSEQETPREGGAGRPAPDGTRAEAPVLVGNPEPNSGATTDAAPSAATSTTTHVPLDAPIPAGKGSVAGRIRFEDGSPLVDVPVALWGSSPIVDRTDAEGRFHLHGDWVAERSIYVKEEGWSLILFPVKMVVDERVVVDATIERGIDVESVVVDERTGEPLPETSVVLRRPENNRQAGAGFATTDAQGRFRFRYLPKTSYTLETTRKGYEGAVRPVDLTTGPWPERVALRPSRPLVLRLQGLSREAFGSRVRWSLSGLSGAFFMVDGEDEIDGEGRLVVDAPMPGPYHLTLFPDGLVPRVEQDIEVPEGEVPPVIVRVPPGGKLTGVLVDPSGSPVEGATLIVDGGSESAKTDGDGRFLFGWAPSGPTGVRLYDDGYRVLVGKVDVPQGGSADVRLTVPGTGSIAGRLLVGGKPPTTAWYAVVSVHDLETRREVAQGNPDTYGRFRFPWLARGRYEVRVWADEARPDAREVAVDDGERDLGDLDLHPYARIPLRLVPPPGEVVPSTTGLSLLAADGSPAPSLQVGSSTWAHSLRITTESDGSQWLTGVPDGRWRVRFHAGDLAPAEIELTVPTDGTTPVEVRFERAR